MVVIKSFISQLKLTLGNVTMRFLMLLLLYQFIRFLFFIINKNIFIDVSFIEYLQVMFFGLRFDISALLIINSVYLLMSTIPIKFVLNTTYQRVNRTIFISLNLIGVLLNIIDIAYFQVSHKRITFDFLNVVSDASNVSLLDSYIKTYWYLVILLILVFAAVKFIANYKRKEFTTQQNNNVHWFVKTLGFVLVGIIIVVGARGGAQMRPITIANAAEYTRPNNIPLVLNSAFTFINSSTNSGLEIVKYYDDKAAEKIYSPIHFLNHNKPFKNLNVVLIVLESFGKEHVGYFNGNKTATPFLDSLMQNGTVFTNAFANATRSIEGIPAILASIPHMSENAFITSPYSANQITSIASLLNAQGYNSTFYHGGRNGTMSFDAFTKLCGYQNYYGLNEYPYQKDFDGHWGIWDEEYLQYFAKEINKKKQPFFSTVFTLSSHDPYNVPDKYKAIFKDGKLPITKTIAYTDFALMQFFNAIKKTSWFKNTLFVFTADHTSNTQNPIFQNSYGYHKIPIFFYQYNQTPKVCKTITQQIDILPNVMEYLNYDQSYFSFGKSTFQNTNSNNIGLHYVDGIYETFTNIQLVKFDTKKITSVYDLTMDSLIQNDVKTSQKMNPFLLEYSRAFLQTYTQCLTQNKMTVENYFRK